MHKGRLYRQVLPHNLTPDMIGHSAPVRLWPFMGFEYAGELDFNTGEVSETLKVDLPTMSIQWRGRITRGSLDFAYLLQQRLFDHEPGITYEVVLTDNFGGLLRSEWHWDESQPGWHSDVGGQFRMGTLVGTVANGLFGTNFAASWFCVEYHEEPP